jgi:hypothetical protein
MCKWAIRQEDFEDTHQVEAFDRWLDANTDAPSA